ncbi:hypothetical protein [Methylocystis heyeri]|uniref:Uncharacterized protein n=1 Tax=Methylocystis heyeri TaxID=391905 RepID=A0A6B8KGC4_9HYPH|nr:hypothetical protein [Methylocystis heyeri]QGM46669.1 hypothetical protein H2LOC_013735 [Methylocystis heyeri]
MNNSRYLSPEFYLPQKPTLAERVGRQAWRGLKCFARKLFWSVFVFGSLLLGFGAAPGATLFALWLVCMVIVILRMGRVDGA